MRKIQAQINVLFTVLEISLSDVSIKFLISNAIQLSSIVCLFVLLRAYSEHIANKQRIITPEYKNSWQYIQEIVFDPSGGESDQWQFSDQWQLAGPANQIDSPSALQTLCSFFNPIRVKTTDRVCPEQRISVLKPFNYWLLNIQYWIFLFSH